MHEASRMGFVAVGLTLLTGCGGEPFPMVKASGRITYDDGSPLTTRRGDTLGLVFLPQIPPRDPKTHPRMGTAVVNPEDGSFPVATTHKFGDGLIRCRYRVSIYTGDDFLPAVPREYCDPDTTPLEVDAAEQPMWIKIRKPVGADAASDRSASALP